VIAIGAGATATGDAAANPQPQVALQGSASQAGGSGTRLDGSGGDGANLIAMGAHALATGAGATAIGPNSKATGTRSTALGSKASATGEQSTALGDHASARGRNSTAIGFSAQAPLDDQVVVGTGTDQYKLPGLASNRKGQQFWANTTYQNGGNKRFVTTDSDGTLGTTSFSVNDLQRSIQGVAAATAALSSLPQTTLLPGETLRCGFGSGVYGTQGAGAFGCAAKASESVFVNIGAAVSSTPYFNGSVAAKAGISWGFGGGSAKQGLKKKEDEHAKIIQNLQDKIALLEASIQALKQQESAHPAEATQPGLNSGSTHLNQLKRDKSRLEAQLQTKLAEQEQRLKQQASVITAQTLQIEQQARLLERQQHQLDSMGTRLQQLEQRSIGITPPTRPNATVTPVSQLIPAAGR